MTFQPPTGSRDLLPLEVVQKTWIRERLQAVFHAWGYQRVVTPTLERLDTLVAGGRVRPEWVVQIQDRDGIYGLRPDVTASIARLAASRWSQIPHPQRLYYVANVFRRHPQRGHCQEFYQVGVELLGAGGLLADAEILRLLQDALASLQLPPWRLILGDAGLTRSWLEQFPAVWQRVATQSLVRLDRVALQQLPDPWRQKALGWLDLRGAPATVFQRLSGWELTLAQRQRVNHLKMLVELLPSELPLVVDLSLVQPWDYYTGIVFQVAVTQGHTVRLVGQGGRYDDLIAAYHPEHKAVPGIGFSFSLEALYQQLLPLGVLPQETAPADWLVIPVDDSAYRAALDYAQQLRRQHPHKRVELALDPASPRPCRQRVWVDVQGHVRFQPPELVC
ncbi:MAG: ATP phosphoribosyltransferase regulatory subunit [Gloeomargarita sp. SKYBB_i_bin120]|nr:ATP phosphoribosyltransferase regulatory subunit [Gloeomargarita sp. SKYG98]MCS7293393.1 ATP phosphoribosyltransferase regulatory subunit [Gloeomargarita sp. SKYB120]MDW8178958.1 ATP phosphoribosyltransferase regulatory subunit [Gloeomargarita sp. SKYBB_i_bin120]